jgi:hypothetical protein
MIFLQPLLLEPSPLEPYEEFRSEFVSLVAVILCGNIFPPARNRWSSNRKAFRLYYSYNLHMDLELEADQSIHNQNLAHSEGCTR